MDKVRVLHIANRLNPGGVERWLLGVAEGLKDSEIATDVLVHSELPGLLDPQFIETGGQIIKCKYSKNPFSYGFQLYRAFKKYGPYDVVHSHVHHFSGFVLMVAFFSGVKLRIAHSHSNRENIEPKTGPRAWYLLLMKRAIKVFANKYVAVSREAQRSLFAKVIPEKDVEILYCGIQHLNNFCVDPNWRTKLGIPEGILVVGHVGRLSEPKNHDFILDVFASVKTKVDAVLVLIGDGELRGKIENKIGNMRLLDDVKLLGMRSDAVDIMASVFDVIVFPSLYEGLPLTVVEAQAVGVPIIVADNLTKEAEFDPQYVRYASLAESSDVWAVKALKVIDECVNTAPSDKYRNTDFYMPNHLIKLGTLYRGLP